MIDATVPFGFPGSDRAVSVVVGWVADAVATRMEKARAANVPLLLTLPESNGSEISELVSRHLIRVAESAGTVHTDDAHLIVALPRNMLHRGYLLRVLAGFKILSETHFRNLLQKAEDLDTGLSNSQCRSGVVNFDRFGLELGSNGRVELFENIERICKLHTLAETSWSLCFWVDLPALQGLAAANAFGNVVDDKKYEDSFAAVTEWISHDVAPPSAEGEAISLVACALMSLQVDLAASGWQVELERLGLVNFDNADINSCVVVLSLNSADVADPAELVENSIAGFSSIEVVHIDDDGECHPF